MTTDQDVTPAEARDLAAAMVAQVASDAGIDLLLIKGSTLSHHGLRDARSGGDVDVLVRPADVLPLTELLRVTGWRPLEDVAPYLRHFSIHATSLHHSRWNTGIDIHREVPGMYAEPVRCFEALWVERCELHLAHRSLPGTGPLGSALVSAVDMERSPVKAAQSGADQSWTATVANWSEDAKAALALLAQETGAADAAGPQLHPAGVPRMGTQSWTRQDRRDWQDRCVMERGGPRSWVVAFRRADLRMKPAVIWDSLGTGPDVYRVGGPSQRGRDQVRTVCRRIIRLMRWLLRSGPDVGR